MDETAEQIRRLEEAEPPPRRPLPDPTTVDARDLSSTVVSATLDVGHQEGKNLLWCATARLAWRSLADFVGGPVLLRPGAPLADQLNVELERPAVTSGSDSVSGAGAIDDGVVDRILVEIEEKLGEAAATAMAPHLRSQAQPGGLLAFAMLRKQLGFAAPFRSGEGGLSFQGVDVERWGIWFYDEDSDRAARQVTVLEYQGPDSFVLEIATTSPEDRLLIARRAPAATLQETVGNVMALAAREPDPESAGFVVREGLTVPVIDFDVTRSYSELVGRHIANAGVSGLPLLEVLQSVRFRLDESGAVLLSSFWAKVGYIRPLRHFVCDGPFLVLLAERGRNLPHLAIWIDNAELLVRSRREEGVHGREP